MKVNRETISKTIETTTLETTHVPMVNIQLSLEEAKHLLFIMGSIGGVGK